MKETVNILVVDDNTPDVVLIEESLRERGLPHTVTHCSDGEQALRLLSTGNRHGFDVMILDLNMPKLGGLEVLKKMKSTPNLNNLPVLVLTSSLVPGEQEEAMRLGAARFLRKPSDLDQFLLHVGAAVGELVAQQQPSARPY
jgi:two-component system, response regulator